MDDNDKTKTQLIEELVALRQQLTIKSQFVAMMSHELRSPLTVILGYTNMLMKGVYGHVSAEGTDILGRVHKSANALCELMTMMLDVSRLEAGRFPVSLRTVTVPVLLQELADETQELREQPAAEVMWRMKGTLPTLYTDREKLKMILRNLLSNAVTCTPDGRITIQVQRCHGGVTFRVTDTGIGIPHDALVMIFEPFYQVERAGWRSRYGTGLGLHIVKRLVELLGGTIAVESEVGTGSTFCLWMPRGAPPQVALGTRTEP